MPTPSPQRRRLLIVTLAVLVVISLIAFGIYRWSQHLPTGEKYQAAVSAFYSGLVALDADDPHHQADTYLTLAAQIAPMEPAAWADLGLYYLRKNNLDEARKNLERAQRLAPKNSQIEGLLGLLERLQGHYAEAITHYRRAVQLDPHNLRARYALAQTLGNQAGPQGEADPQIQQQYDALLAEAPDNLFVALETAKNATLAGDAASLHTAVARIAAHAGDFLPDAKAALKTLQSASAGPAAAARIPLLSLEHLVYQQPPYEDAAEAVRETSRFSTEAIGWPLEHFVVLPSPSPTPAPPDTALHFAPQPLPPPLSTVRASVVQTFSPTPEVVPLLSPDNRGNKFNLPANPEGPPATLTADGRQVRIAPEGAAVLTLPFPGGPKAVPPTPDGVLAADYNYDFRPDLVLAGAGGLRLLTQQPRAANAPPTWADVTARTGLPPAVVNGTYTGAWAADVDTDGDLDIVLGTPDGPPVVLRNNGTPADAPTRPQAANADTFAVLHPFPGARSGLRAFAWGDFDGDGVPDAAFIDGQGRVAVYHNGRAGQFQLWPLPPSFGKAAALSVADVTRRGTMDLVALGTDGVIRRLSRRDVSLPGEPDPGWDVAEIARWPAVPHDGSARLLWADLDNNGGLDLIATGSGGSQVWLSDVQGKLIPLGGPLVQRALSVDYAGDKGRLNLVGLTPEGQPVRLANLGSKNYFWQIVKTFSDRTDPLSQDPTAGDKRINSFGIGGEMEMRAGLLYQKQPITQRVLHFGLGNASKADMIRILWPNGFPNGYFDLVADQSEVAPQNLKGSCPWLFADDGHGMKFVTDLIWRSPLGLRLNAQATAGVVQTQDWVKIRGDQLAARDGFYNLSITAELWETHFFDYIALMTVDHPVGSDVFVDERFAIPPPPLKVYAMTPPVPVRKATDDLGHDVTDIVRARDGRYLDTFGKGAYQGITRDHWVTLDLGPAPAGPAPQWLVAYGWIHPTDSSINVAISQGRHDPPQQMRLEIPDGHGGWRVALPKLGFPEGKNKTCLIDITGLFRPGAARRVRLRTNLEIFWDFLGTATGLPQTPLRTRRLAPGAADLRYRGFSATHQAGWSSPEIPDYNTVAGTGPRWIDLTGYYTRFGDVRPLLAKVDDRYVIMNAGDEMRLRFAAPPPPPAGWTRDYVLIADGWEKDGDFNTRFSQTVLPLPSHRRPAYDTPPGRLEDDPVYKAHRQDWVTYQTRYVTPRRFHDALLPR
ncbi:MAG: VCBS repeat-containing protein [Armatimonadetes bacterium]|nr:VCBS repeat-containing protein [Armatimonadota bacterium]